MKLDAGEAMDAARDNNGVESLKADTSDSLPPPERLPAEIDDAGLSYANYGSARTVYLGNYETVGGYFRVKLPCRSTAVAIRETYNAIGVWVEDVLAADVETTRRAVEEGVVESPICLRPVLPSSVVDSAVGEMEYFGRITVTPGEGQSRRIEGGVMVPVRAKPEALVKAFEYLYKEVMDRLQKRLAAEAMR